MFYLSYFLFLPLCALYAWGVSGSAHRALIPFAVTFVAIPIFDYLAGLRTHNPDPAQAEKWKQRSYWAPPVYLFSLSLFVLLAYGVLQVQGQSFIKVLSVGIIVGLYGGIGINVAHELMHRRDATSRFLAHALLTVVCYEHFFIEHIYGHHLNVATAEDPATSRKDESLYAFLPRTVFYSYVHGWQLERKISGAYVSFKNRIFVAHVCSLAILLGLSYLSWNSAVFFLIQSVIAILVLECVNYIEHYGLTRKTTARGSFERVQPVHAWNSSHSLANSLLFNLQRHSDHHAHAHLPYTVLRHHDEAPQLPANYPAMILLAIVPYFWFRVMNRRLARWQSTSQLSEAG